MTERLGEKGESTAERVLDELILARVRFLTKAERTEFLAHVRDLVDSVDDATVTVEVEVESVDAELDETDQAEGQDE